MNTEKVTVCQKGEDFEIIVQHDQSGSSYAMPLSKNAYEQLRQHFVIGSLPDELLVWWRSKRPLMWEDNEHLANPTINCLGESENALAKYIAKNYSGTFYSQSTR